MKTNVTPFYFEHKLFYRVVSNSGLVTWLTRKGNDVFTRSHNYKVTEFEHNFIKQLEEAFTAYQDVLKTQ